MPRIDEIRDALGRRHPRLLEGDRRAAVALVLREGARGSEVLFIERARFEDDPWSGHMAFPGGRVDPGDADARRAAERETEEEVGLSLARAEPLGRLHDLKEFGRPEGLVISAFAYHLPDPGPLRPNYEVASAFFVPLRDLLDPARHVAWRRPGLPVAFPGIVVGDPDRHVVWGLTFRFLEDFFEALGRPLRHPVPFPRRPR